MGRVVGAIAPLVKGRSEVDVVADAVVAVLAGGLLKATAANISLLAKATGVEVNDVKKAWRRRDDGKYEPPRRVLTDVSTEETDEPSSRAMAGYGRSRAPLHVTTSNPKPDVEKRVCIRCKTPKPIEQFALRSDKTPAGNPRSSRRTECDDCRKRYQRERYLDVATSERLGTILRFIVQEGDVIVGDACTECHEPFLVGDVVETADVILMHHGECPAMSL